jgi:hypothetical protein
MRHDPATAKAFSDRVSRRTFVLGGLSAAGGLIVSVALRNAANALGCIHGGRSGRMRTRSMRSSSLSPTEVFSFVHHTLRWGRALLRHQ